MSSITGCPILFTLPHGCRIPCEVCVGQLAARITKAEAQVARLGAVVEAVKAERAARARFMAAVLGGGPEVFTSETRQQAVDAYDAACLATERALAALDAKEKGAQE